MAEETPRVEPATGEVCPTLADDLLRGADEIAEFVFGNTKHRRKIYYYATDAKLRMPVFRIGAIICARKSTLLEWIRQQEGVR
ncbi:MAG: DNA-binding protein [Pseudorhodoplanes sp.]|nr:DNA-binding protein [Pseudorhodoplanes sp.]